MAMINTETGETLTGRPRGVASKPAVKASMAPAFLALARTVTLEDPIDMQKAAKYLIKLAAYLQSDEYAKRCANQCQATANYRKRNAKP